ncbi:MAG: site-specific DNA-methyltransferase [Roseomonas sp.]|jgi:site-specific DNA-methyltransferase (adenine-specific)/modification methylase|nr:site-specific DNA-methyltransferase [Roseomonas sp.]
MVVRVEKIGNATLYLGDCREILPGLERPAAVITDPPYGIGFQWTNKKRIGRNLAGSAEFQPEWKNIVGDDRAFDASFLLDFDRVILWGANNFENMPAARGWLVWDKRRATTPDHHGDAELAWSNVDGVVRVHRQLWRGLIREGEENASKQRKVHPTQKPVALMRWCIEKARVPPGGVILDPYMGSGSTGVAAMQLGHPFTGIEIDPGYFDTACRRIEAAARQGVLQPSAAPVKP